MKRLRTEGIIIHRAETFAPGDYHIAVNPDGSTRDIVPIDDKAEHAIFFNSTTIAIAVVGDFAALEKAKLSVPTQAQIVTVIRLLRELNVKYGGKLYAAGHSQLGTKATNVPEKLTYGHTCPGERFPLADVILQSGLYTWPLVASPK